MLDPRARVLSITEKLLKTYYCHTAFVLLISRSFPRNIQKLYPLWVLKLPWGRIGIVCSCLVIKWSSRLPRDVISNQNKEI